MYDETDDKTRQCPRPHADSNKKSDIGVRGLCSHSKSVVIANPSDYRRRWIVAPPRTVSPVKSYSTSDCPGVTARSGVSK